MSWGLPPGVTDDHIDRLYDDDDWGDKEPTCGRCHGAGYILVCIDVLCRGAGECMHGDGEIVCPVCGGEGLW